MLVNQELKKDIERHFTMKKSGKSPCPAFYPTGYNICNLDLYKVLQGGTDVPRRVIRHIASVSGHPVSHYLVK